MTDEQTEKLLAQAEQEWANQLPSWAERLAEDHEIVVGTQLPTRDGRKIGNAWVTNVNTCGDLLLFTVRTEAGNEIALTFWEIDELFHPPKYVGRLEEINKKFPRLQDRE